MAGFLDILGRGAAGLFTGGLSEVANSVSGGGLYGNGQQGGGPQGESMLDLSERLRPDYLSTVDPATGQLKNSLLGQLGQQQQNQTNDIAAIRQRATGTGPSAWAQMATNKQGIEEQQARGQSAAQGASAQAQARSQLAMRGGLSGGARQRLAMQGARDQASRGQQVGAQGQLARANIGLQDEQQRTSLLTQLPGMEAQKNSAWQQMAGNEQNLAAQGLQGQNQANMQKYQSQLQAQAAEKQAQATEKAGKK